MEESIEERNRRPGIRTSTITSHIEPEINTDFLDFFDESSFKRANRGLNTHSDYRDALLCSLYSQVEFLKAELKEKNYLIRSLLGNKSENSSVVYNDGEEQSSVHETPQTLSMESSRSDDGIGTGPTSLFDSFNELGDSGDAMSSPRDFVQDDQTIKENGVLNQTQNQENLDESLTDYNTMPFNVMTNDYTVKNTPPVDFTDLVVVSNSKPAIFEEDNTNISIPIESLESRKEDDSIIIDYRYRNNLLTMDSTMKSKVTQIKSYKDTHELVESIVPQYNSKNNSSSDHNCIQSDGKETFVSSVAIHTEPTYLMNLKTYSERAMKSDAGAGSDSSHTSNVKPINGNMDKLAVKDPETSNIKDNEISDDDLQIGDQQNKPEKNMVDKFVEFSTSDVIISTSKSTSENKKSIVVEIEPFNYRDSLTGKKNNSNSTEVIDMKEKQYYDKEMEKEIRIAITQNKTLKDTKPVEDIDVKPNDDNIENAKLVEDIDIKSNNVMSDSKSVEEIEAYIKPKENTVDKKPVDTAKVEETRVKRASHSCVPGCSHGHRGKLTSRKNTDAENLHARDNIDSSSFITVKRKKKERTQRKSINETGLPQASRNRRFSSTSMYQKAKTSEARKPLSGSSFRRTSSFSRSSYGENKRSYSCDKIVYGEQRKQILKKIESKLPKPDSTRPILNTGKTSLTKEDVNILLEKESREADCQGKTSSEKTALINRRVSYSDITSKRIHK